MSSPRNFESAAAQAMQHTHALRRLESVAHVREELTAVERDAVEQAVRGALMDGTVECPGLAQEIAGHDCLEWQKRARKLRATSPLAVRMFRACRSGCAHSRLSPE